MADNEIYVRITKNNLLRMANASDDEMMKVFRAMGLEGVAIARESMANSPASGATYTRGSRTHTASSPGNPPRIDTGNLVNTLRSEDVNNGVAIIAGSGENAYAPYLEFGTAKMAARPFMGPMALQLEQLLPRFFDKFLEDEADS